MLLFLLNSALYRSSGESQLFLTLVSNIQQMQIFIVSFRQYLLTMASALTRLPCKSSVLLRLRIVKKKSGPMSVKRMRFVNGIGVKVISSQTDLMSCNKSSSQTNSEICHGSFFTVDFNISSCNKLFSSGEQVSRNTLKGLFSLDSSE